MSETVLSPTLTLPTSLPLMDQIRANPRIPTMVGSAVLVTAVVAMLMFNRAPDYGVLYTNLSDRDGGAIIASLQQMNIPYKFAEGGGALMIAANKVPEARLKLAAQGLPKGGTVGFELMDNQKFGTSQFAEQVNYQRALEGELSRSINSISSVESSRVHLALTKPSLFVRDQKKPTASVILTLHRGRSLDEGQVSAIIHLISSSVPELSEKSITVVDQAGNLLSSANSGTRTLDVTQVKYSQEIEQAYIHRIEAILSPIVGASNVHAQVVADIDFSVVEHTDETFKPNQDPKTAAIRSQQSSESGQQGSATAGGVPGSLSNQPPISPIAPIVNPASQKTDPKAPVKMGQEPSSSGGSNSTNNRKDSTTNYEVDRSIRHVQQGAGGIKRLSAAVVVNYRATTNPQGKMVNTALSEKELGQIKDLIKEAMGFNAERGDSVNVVNNLFTTDPTIEIPALPIWQQPANISMAKTAAFYLFLGAVALFAWFSIFRPVLRKFVGPTQGLQQTTLLSSPDVKHTKESKEAEVLVKAQMEERLQQRHQENIKAAQDDATNDPKTVAMLIKNWMAPQ